VRDRERDPRKNKKLYRRKRNYKEHIYKQKYQKTSRERERKREKESTEPAKQMQ
jgi:hypothetical protein